jgi:hypothetical protein
LIALFTLFSDAQFVIPLERMNFIPGSITGSLFRRFSRFDRIFIWKMFKNRMISCSLFSTLSALNDQKSLIRSFSLPYAFFTLFIIPTFLISYSFLLNPLHAPTANSYAWKVLCASNLLS